jgi:hypothetical protein
MMLPFSCAPSSSSSSSYSASSATTGSPASCASDDDGSGDGGDEETDQRLVDGNAVPAVAEASIASSSIEILDGSRYSGAPHIALSAEEALMIDPSLDILGEDHGAAKGVGPFVAAAPDGGGNSNGNGNGGADRKERAEDDLALEYSLDGDSSAAPSVVSSICNTPMSGTVPTTAPGCPISGSPLCAVRPHSPTEPFLSPVLLLVDGSGAGVPSPLKLLPPSLQSSRQRSDSASGGGRGECMSGRSEGSATSDSDGSDRSRETWPHEPCGGVERGFTPLLTEGGAGDRGRKAMNQHVESLLAKWIDLTSPMRKGSTINTPERGEEEGRRGENNHQSGGKQQVRRSPTSALITASLDAFHRRFDLVRRGIWWLYDTGTDIGGAEAGAVVDKKERRHFVALCKYLSSPLHEEESGGLSPAAFHRRFAQSLVPPSSSSSLPSLPMEDAASIGMLMPPPPLPMSTSRFLDIYSQFGSEASSSATCTALSPTASTAVAAVAATSATATAITADTTMSPKDAKLLNRRDFFTSTLEASPYASKGRRQRGSNNDLDMSSNSSLPRGEDDLSRGSGDQPSRLAVARIRKLGASARAELFLLQGVDSRRGDDREYVVANGLLGGDYESRSPWPVGNKVQLRHQSPSPTEGSSVDDGVDPQVMNTSRAKQTKRKRAVLNRCLMAYVITTFMT